MSKTQFIFQACVAAVCLLYLNNMLYMCILYIEYLSLSFTLNEQRHMERFGPRSGEALL